MPRIKKEKVETAFTLMELLITIAILGVIAIIALPAVSKLRESNEKAKYTAFSKTFINAGKLYNDAYSEDLFGTAKSGCVDITFNELEHKKLIKDIQIEDTTCNWNDGSVVRIRRSGDNYYYEIFMNCTKNEESVYKTKNWDSYNPEDCQMNIAGDIDPPNWGMKLIYNNVEVKPGEVYVKIDDKKLLAKVEVLDSSSGLAKNLKLNYIWSYKANDSDTYKELASNTQVFNTQVAASSATTTIPAPAKVKDKDIDGIIAITVIPTLIRDTFDRRISQENTITKEITIDNTDDPAPEPDDPTPTPIGVPKVPTVKLYKWKDVDTEPTSSSGLKSYSNNTWFSRKVYTEATGGGSNVAYYRYNVTGASTNATNTKGSHRNIAAQGTSYIQYQACNSENKCSKYSNKYTIKLDRGEPHCSISKSNTYSTGGVTLKTHCTDGRSGVIKCAGDTKGGALEYTVTQKSVKKSHEYTVKDEASNTNTCSVTVSKQLQKRTRTWNSCKTKTTTYSCPSGYTSVGGGVCSRSWTFSSRSACLSSSCHSGGNDCKYISTTGRYTCNDRTTTVAKTTCHGGWNSYGSWSNVSSCSKSSSTECRTVYK